MSEPLPSALGTAAALRRGELDARELAEQTLAAARGIGAEVGAFAHLLEERSRQQAEAAQAELVAARDAGRL